MGHVRLDRFGSIGYGKSGSFEGFCGGGDCFGGGIIYSLLNGKSSKDAIEFAVAASALKHMVESDYSCVSVSEVKKLVGGDESRRVPCSHPSNSKGI